MSTLFKQPSNNRDWSADQSLLAHIEIAGETITIHHIRNISYRTTNDYTVAYYDKTFNLKDVVSLDYILEPFSTSPILAHTLLSFGLADGTFIAISIEIRKKKNDKFSVIKGLFNYFEVQYVIADERDVVKLRSNFRKDAVYIYPLNLTPRQIQLVFLAMIAKTKELETVPEFYNTLTNSCTINTIRYLNGTLKKRIPLNHKILVNGKSDKLLFDHGLIKDAEDTLAKTRAKYQINKRAFEFADDPNFSQKIRQQ